MILVSNKFSSEARPDVRSVGALVGACIGLLVMAAGILLADGSARATTLVVGVAVLVVAMPLGWLFAHRATQPGLRSALATAAGITVIAVPLGALAIGTLTAVGADGLSWGEVVVSGVAMGFVGLLFLGLPLAGLTFVVASVWVGVLRLIVGGWRGGCGSYDMSPGNWPNSDTSSNTSDRS